MRIYGTQIPPKYISLKDVGSTINKKINLIECEFNVYNDLDYSDLYFYFQEKLKHSNLLFCISNEVILESNLFDFDLYYDLQYERDISVDRSYLFYIGVPITKNVKTVEHTICEIFNCQNLNFGFFDEVSHPPF